MSRPLAMRYVASMDHFTDLMDTRTELPDHTLSGEGYTMEDFASARATAQGRIEVRTGCGCGRPVQLTLGHADVLACVALALGGRPDTWAPRVAPGERPQQVPALRAIPERSRGSDEGVAYAHVTFERCVGFCSSFDSRAVRIPHAIVREALFAMWRTSEPLDGDVAHALHAALVRATAGRVGVAVTALIDRAHEPARWIERTIERSVRKVAEPKIDRAIEATIGYGARTLREIVDRRVERAVEMALSKLVDQMSRAPEAGPGTPARDREK